MVRITQVKPHLCPTLFPVMSLAREWCVGSGIEIGAAAHNPFDLEGCLNVSLPELEEEDRACQVRLCGGYAEVDVYADAADLPFEAGSLDYVLSSHVLEHLADPIKALCEWHRVLREGGVVFLIVPHRDALPSDAARPITPLQDFIDAHAQGYTAETFRDAPEGPHGHHWVFTLDRLLELVEEIGHRYDAPFKIEKTETIDSKVGNGCTLVATKLPAPDGGPAAEITETEKPGKPKGKRTKRAKP